MESEWTSYPATRAPPPPRGALGGGQVSGQDTHGGGFTRAVRSQKTTGSPLALPQR